MLKELGKLTPQLRDKEGPLLKQGAAQNRGWRLFIKNTGLSKIAILGIGSDACPVLATKGKG